MKNAFALTSLSILLAMQSMPAQATLLNGGGGLSNRGLISGIIEELFRTPDPTVIGMQPAAVPAERQWVTIDPALRSGLDDLRAREAQLLSPSTIYMANCQSWKPLPYGKKANEQQSVSYLVVTRGEVGELGLMNYSSLEKARQGIDGKILYHTPDSGRQNLEVNELRRKIESIASVQNAIEVRHTGELKFDVTYSSRTKGPRTMDYTQTTMLQEISDQELRLSINFWSKMAGVRGVDNSDKKIVCSAVKM